ASGRATSCSAGSRAPKASPAASCASRARRSGSDPAPSMSGSARGTGSSRSGRFGGASVRSVCAAAGHAEIESDAASTSGERLLRRFRLVIGQVPEVDPQRDVVPRDDDTLLDTGTEAPLPDRADDRFVLEAGGLGLDDANVGRAPVPIHVECDDHVARTRVRGAAQAALADRLVEHAVELLEPLAAQLV